MQRKKHSPQTGGSKQVSTIHDTIVCVVSHQGEKDRRKCYWLIKTLVFVVKFINWYFHILTIRRF